MILLLLLSNIAWGNSSVEALLAKVGREAVLQSDVERFEAVSDVLICAGVLEKSEAPAEDKRKLLDQYIDEELMFLEARSKRISTAGQVQKAVQSIHEKDECKGRWQKLGKDFSQYYRTEARMREGESLLVRELEKRILVLQFKHSGAISDGELWKREARARYPVKVYLE